MLSYWCPSRCRFCYVCAGPDPRAWADPGLVTDWWQGLETIANRQDRHTRIHITGGDPFGRPELLFEVLQRAKHAGLPSAEKVETNAFWAADDDIVRRDLTKLRSLGVTRIVTAADIFHQEFVPLANVKRIVRVAKEVFGDDGITVRWWDFYNRYADTEFDVADLTDHQRAEMQAEALAGGRDRLTGQAAFLAAELLDGQPPDRFKGQSCEKNILKSKHVHIDPYGNVFPGVCCGLVLGNAVNEGIEDIYDWLDRHGPTGPIFSPLVREGPAALTDLAERFGFQPLKQGYVTKCQLCYHIRWTLFRANQCRKWLGPAECYPPGFP